jgi:hypothetical protein
MKSAMSGKLALMPAIKTLMDEVMAGPVRRKIVKVRWRRSSTAGEREEADAVCGRCGDAEVYAAIADEQEVMGAIADMIIEVFVMESCILRAEKISITQGSGGSE